MAYHRTQDGLKWCYKCSSYKPTSDFYKCSRNGDGLQSSCKLCSLNLCKDWQSKNPTKVKDLRKEYYYADLNKNRERVKKVRRLYPSNPQVSVEYKKNNPDKVRNWKRNFKHKRKSWERSGYVSLDDWNDLVIFYGNKCLCCGTSENLTQDHVIPLSKGGKHDISNLQPLCARCNSRKYNKTIDYRVEK